MADFMPRERLTCRLRWRFDFSDKPPKWGFWSQPGNAKIGGQAWAVNKSGLVRAAIECESTSTHKLWVGVECDGWDFVNFEWVGGTTTPNLFAIRGSVELAPQIVGMRLHSRDMVYTVMMDGSPVMVRPRTAAEKKQNLAGFSR
jgi:hypothetical protein